LQNEATGVRDGIVEENAVGEVVLIDAMSIMMQPMNPAGDFESTSVARGPPLACRLSVC
jgi:hypothetical protein